MSKGLEPRQVEKFHGDGFLIVRNLLPPEAVGAIIEELEHKIDETANEAVSRGILAATDTFPGAPFDTRLALMSNACSDRDWLWGQVHGKHHKTAGMFTLRTWPALLDAAESLIGPEILAHPQAVLRGKLPDHEKGVVPWHQDLAYLIPEEAGETLIVNFWIPLVRATADNGCLQVLRGSHREGLLPHNSRQSGYIGVAEPELPDGDVVTCELDVGDVVLTRERLLHRSIPNRSNTVRWSVDSRYSGLGLPTGRPHSVGFVARSHENPDAVARSHHDWLKLFTDAGIDLNG